MKKYEIKGDNLPVVICELAPGESMITERGSMSWMTSNITMETSGGGMKKMLGRLTSGDSAFQNAYTAQGGDGSIAFASSFPGEIKVLNIAPGQEMVVQKSAFLAAESGVELSIHFHKRFGTGLFGGEGFIMQRLTGDGIVFLNAGGTIIKKTLQAGEMLKIDTGCLVAMSETVDYDVAFQTDIKSGFLGGEGLFLATLTGPGEVWLQSLPFSRMADEIIKASRSNKEENKGLNNPLGEVTGGLNNALGGLFKF